MGRFVPSMHVVLTITVGALLLSGCSGKAASTAPAPRAATPAPAAALSAGMNAAQDASQAVGQINAQTGAADDGTQ